MQQDHLGMLSEFAHLERELRELAGRQTAEFHASQQSNLLKAVVHIYLGQIQEKHGAMVALTCTEELRPLLDEREQHFQKVTRSK